MQTAALVLIVIFGAFLALWPIAFLAAAVVHAVAKRWHRIGQVALLLPLWSISASIGLIQFPRLLRAFEPSVQSGASLGSVAAVVLALCCAAIAWALLLRSFGAPSAAPSPSDKGSSAS
jgi:hypothetical protein